MKSNLLIKRKSRGIKWLLALISILCLGGVGTGIYFAVYFGYEITVTQNENGTIAPGTKIVKKDADAEF